MSQSLTVLGIDPGYAIVGFGLLRREGPRLVHLRHGAITTPAGLPAARRLLILYEDLCDLLDAQKPDAVAVEKLFFNTNTTTALAVAQARGVILLAAAQRGLPLFEYTPLQIKQAVVGYGRAEKQQVMQMTRALLSLSDLPRPDDAADALAAAICHANTSTSLL